MRRMLIVDGDLVTLKKVQSDLSQLRSDWQIDLAENGRLAWDRLQQSEFDALVCGPKLQGMNCLELLERARDHQPSQFRLASTDRAEQDAALRLLGIAHQVVAYPLDAPSLVARISRAFELRTKLEDAQIRAVLAQIHKLPSLPPLYLELLEELRDEEVSVSRISQLVSRDLGMSTKMLQLVNSAYFGIPHAVQRMEEAVTYIGIDMLRVLVLTLQVFSLFDVSRVKGFSFDKLWKHSWRVGALARKIAAIEGWEQNRADEAFMSGLLHDLGKLLLVTGLAPRYQEVAHEMEKVLMPDWEAEQKVLGVTHADLGAYLLSMWGLPDPVVETVLWHHQPGAVSDSELTQVALVHIANAIDHGTMLPRAILELGWLDCKLLEKLGLTGQFTRWQEIANTLA
jgi:HD-like signal output (HDOD) protein